MASPFPGVDPFIELCGLWPDFHATLINYLREALADNLPQSYEARIGERVQLYTRTERSEQLRRIVPDVAVSRSRSGESASGAARRSGAATLEPVALLLPVQEEVRETYLEILHRPERRLVTSIEVLSPANKEEPGRSQYASKRGLLIVQAVHLLELDLLLGGERLPFAAPLPPGDLYAMLSRAERRPLCDVYAWTLCDPLPRLPVPLLAPDPDLWLDLGATCALVCERGRYARSIDYSTPLPAFLGGERAAWMAERAADAGR